MKLRSLVRVSLPLLASLLISPSALAASPPPAKPDYSPPGYTLKWEWQSSPPDSGQFLITGNRNQPSTTDPSTGRTTVYSGGLGVLEWWHRNATTDTWQMTSRFGKRSDIEEETGPDFHRLDTTIFDVLSTDVKDTLVHTRTSKEITSYGDTVVSDHNWTATYSDGAEAHKEGYEKTRIASDHIIWVQSDKYQFITDSLETLQWTGPVGYRWTRGDTASENTKVKNDVYRTHVTAQTTTLRAYRSFDGDMTAQTRYQWKDQREIFGENITTWKISKDVVSITYDPAGAVAHTADDSAVTTREYGFSSVTGDYLRKTKLDAKRSVDGVTARSFARETNFFAPELGGGGQDFTGTLVVNGATKKVELAWKIAAPHDLYIAKVDGQTFFFPLSAADRLAVTRAYRTLYNWEPQFTGVEAEIDAYPYMNDLWDF
jgi:hypothetical protein